MLLSKWSINTPFTHELLRIPHAPLQIPMPSARLWLVLDKTEERVWDTTELLHKPELGSAAVRQKQDSFCGAAHNNQYLFCLLWIISRGVNISHTYQLSGLSRDASLSTQPQNLEIKMSQPKPFQNEIVSCTDPPYGFCSLALKAPENNKLPDIQLIFPFFLIPSWCS